MAGVRYTAVSGTVTFQPTDTSATFTVPVLANATFDYKQSVQLELSQPTGGATLGTQSTAVLDILGNAAALDLSALQQSNYVNIPAEGSNSLKYLPDGSLAQLLWLGTPQSGGVSSNHQLTYLHRNVFGQWEPEVVTTDTNSSGVNLQFDFYNAQLLVDSTGTPHVLLMMTTFDASDNPIQEVLHYRRSASAGWQQVDAIPLPMIYGAFGNGLNLTASFGVNDSLHFAATGPIGNGTGYVLVYGTNKTGTWQVQTVTPLANQSPFLQLELPRFFSLAVDSHNAAHIAYTPGFLDNKPPGQFFDRPYSQLAYATNRSGNWTTQVVWQPPGDAGDAGYGASIAVGPGDLVAIASFYVARVETGSPASAELLFHVLQPSGQFASGVVTATPDGYAAADGAKFTGNAPQLHFDAQGRPTIVFSDYASQHFPSIGAVEFAGQLRQATFVGNQWVLQTIIRQTNPLVNEFAYPSVAFSPTGAAYSGLQVVSAGASAAGPGTLQSVTYTLITTDSGVLGPKLASAASFFTHSAENYGNIIDAAYNRYLKRLPDASGLAYWIKVMQGGVTDEQLEAFFLGSREYIVDHGGVNPNGVPLPAWVQGMYMDLLGRQADTSGLAFWSSQLALGVPASSIAVGFAASSERERTRIGANYTTYLDRPADDAGVNFWLGQFLVGKTNEDLAAGFIGSPEFYFDHGHGTPATWINALYEEILHRAAATSEVNSWLSFLGVA
jgi:hypothetical protein